jgi:hypothetical protein
MTPEGETPSRIDADLWLLFSQTKEDWDKLKRSDLAAQNLADLEELQGKFDKYEQLHIERCCWLASEKADLENYNTQKDKNLEQKKQRHYSLTPAEFRRKKREWTYIWLRRVWQEHNRTDDPALTLNLDEIEELGFTRENMVAQIIGKNKGKLNDFFKNEKDQVDAIGRRHLERLAEWFMTRRYDLSTARWIVQQCLQLDSPRLSPVHGQKILFVLSALVFAALASLFPNWWQHFYKSQNDLYYTAKLAYGLGGLATVTAYALLLSNVFDLFCSPLKFILLTPRLLAGVIVGYLALSLERDVWLFAATCSKELLIVIVAGMLVMSFSYLLFKVRQALGEEQKQDAFKRSLRLFRRGLVMSIVIGLVQMDWFAYGFLHEVADKIQPPILWGYLGVLPLKILCLFACAALLVGIIVQIIWEDKPITDTL